MVRHAAVEANAEQAPATVKLPALLHRERNNQAHERERVTETRPVSGHLLHKELVADLLLMERSDAGKLSESQGLTSFDPVP